MAVDLALSVRGWRVVMKKELQLQLGRIFSPRASRFRRNEVVIDFVLHYKVYGKFDCNGH